MRRTPLPLLLLAALVTACGSTVPLAQQDVVAPGGLTADPGLTLEGQPSGPAVDLPLAQGGEPASSAGAGGSVTAPGAPRTTTTTTGGGTVTAPTGQAPAAPGATTAAAAAAVPAKGPGWDEKNVYIGVITQKDAREVFGRFGGDVDPGDTERQAAAMAAELNAKGGVLGRKVVPVFRDQATLATATDPNGTGAATCSYFAEDRRVLAVVNIVTVMDFQPFRACLAKARIPLFSAGVKAVDDAAGRSLAPHFYQSLAVSWDALAPALVQRLEAQGWFAGWNVRTGTTGPGTAKVGVLVDGSDVGTRVGKKLVRVLADAGHPGALVYQYGQASDGQGASVNYFAGNDVTHVIVTDVELLAFQSSANGQGYRPRYGITTYNAPANNLQSSLSPAGQNEGALGVGWAPTLDVSADKDPGATPARRACLAVMAKGGQTFGGKRLAEAYATSLCDAMTLVRDGAAAGGGLTPDRLFAGAMSIGPRFGTAVGFSSGLATDRLFVPGTVRDLAWDSSCRCVAYRAGTAKL